MVWVCTRLCKLQKKGALDSVASDKVCQLLAHGQWFSPGTAYSSTTKTGRHDIAETLLKVELNTINQTKSIQTSWRLTSKFLVPYGNNAVSDMCT
jgi:hypothetical protein